LEYQQGGLIIYQNDNNYIKLVRLYDGYYKLEFLAEANGTTVRQASTPIAGEVPIKLVRKGNTCSGYYSPDGATWRSLGQPITLNLSNPRIGLTAYSQLAVDQIPAYWPSGDKGPE
jgi:cytochrome c